MGASCRLGSQGRARYSVLAASGSLASVVMVPVVPVAPVALAALVVVQSVLSALSLEAAVAADLAMVGSQRSQLGGYFPSPCPHC